MRILILIEDVPRTRPGIPVGAPTGGIRASLAHDYPAHSSSRVPRTDAYALGEAILRWIEKVTAPDDPPSTSLPARREP